MKRFKYIKYLLIGILTVLTPSSDAEPDRIFIGKFSEKHINGWDSKKFQGDTAYSFSILDGQVVLKADSHKAASGLVKEIRIDLEKTPFLNWRWRIKNKLAGTFDEKQKTGDDYAARVYVVKSGGIFVWNTKALNYVWAKHSARNDTWPNAFAENNAVMTALRSSEARVNVWQTEKRNIKNDFKQFFGKDIRYIDAVALMTDTDNTKNKVTSYYGDIYFSSD